MQRFVWWDDVRRREVSRVDLRVPRPLLDFLREVAQIHDVSLNSLIVGILGYAVDAEHRRVLFVEVVPDVRVTEKKPADNPVKVPVPVPSASFRGTSTRRKVR